MTKKFVQEMLYALFGDPNITSNILEACFQRISLGYSYRKMF